MVRTDALRSTLRMTLDVERFRVRADKVLRIKDRPTCVPPVCQSGQKHKAMLASRVRVVANLQRPLYAGRRSALACLTLHRVSTLGTVTPP